MMSGPRTLLQPKMYVIINIIYYFVVPVVIVVAVTGIRLVRQAAVRHREWGRILRACWEQVLRPR